MAILRKQKKSNFTVIDNGIFKDSNLSLKAKGLLCLMLSVRDDWSFSIVGLSKCCKDGKDSVASALKELERAGYFKRVQVKTGGKFEGVEYVVSEVKMADSPYTENPNTENSDTEIPISENPSQLNTDNNKELSLLITDGIKNSPPTPSQRGEELETLLDSKGFNGELKSAVRDWLLYKKEKNQAYKPVGLENLLTQIANNATRYGDETVIDTIRKSMAANYMGITWDWLKRGNNGYSGTNEHHSEWHEGTAGEEPDGWGNIFG